jgi:hypothetical protein
MKHGESNSTPNYCPDCRKSGTYERYPIMDIKTESGAIFEEYWKCKTPNCPGHTYVFKVK